MNKILKPFPIAILGVMTMLALSSCSLGQAAAGPTATAIDINAIMTSAAATAFVQLTQIAGQASPTHAPTQTATKVRFTSTPNAPSGSATQASVMEIAAPTSTGAAAGLPAVNTPLATSILQTNIAAPGFTPLAPIVKVTAGPTCFNSSFVADVTIPDGTVLKPYEKFTKIWRVENTGICAWDQGFGLTIWAGPAMNGTPIYYSNNDQAVQPGGIVDLPIEMRAPSEPGDYIAHWILINDQGDTFGTDLTIFIKVVN